MEGLIARAPMTDLLRERGVFGRHPFVLLDVGCAGGIHPAWRAFGPTLVAHGFDPDAAACEEAQVAEPFPDVRYHARYVGLLDSHPFVQRQRVDAGRWPTTSIWSRVTAGRLAADRPEAASRRLTDASTRIGVDEIVSEQQLATVDFIKVDVDGPDVEVLESSRHVLTDRQVLGVGMEVNWFGSANPTEHTFHNTDRFLREQGFALFGLTVRRYSRVDLPAPFEYESYAQTTFGQPFQGDAIYVRDLAAPYLQDVAASYPDEKLVKLACVYELIGLPDCAAEVLNRFPARVARFGDRVALLDALTPSLLDEHLTYRQYVETFERDPKRFLPSAARSSSDDADRPRVEVNPTPEEVAERERWMHAVVDGWGRRARRVVRRVHRKLAPALRR